MHDPNGAAQLRERSQDLRDLATAMERSPVMTLDRYADEETWRGRNPSLCRAILAANQRQVHAAAEELRWSAYLCERQAVEIEVMIGDTVRITG